MADAAISTIHVRLAERSYDIEIGSGTLGRTSELVVSALQPSKVVVITDRNVQLPHAREVIDGFRHRGAEVQQAVIPPGEASKSVAEAQRLWQELLALGVDRKAVVVAVGGGVVGDLAGFVAATYARGLNFFQVPTTLLAQVDSSVGGKVGINLPGAKNMVGAFWQPRGVLIDTQVLETLPEREYRAGLAEVVKYGVILDADFFRYLEEHLDGLNERRADTLRHAIARSCQLKADVVQQDEREVSGLRAVLNYGHTFCHAIEAVTGYGQFLHGEAVSIGMLCASRLAESLGRIHADTTRRQRDLLDALQLPIELPPLDREQLVEVMRHDKKTERGQLRFVLPSRLGQVELVDGVPTEKVLAAMA